MKQKFIPASVLERLREQVDLLAVVRERVQLLQSGDEWRGQCPFHAARRRPPLRVLPHKKLFRCMSCGEEGDAIDFVMKSKSCLFRDAVAILSARLVPAADPAIAALEHAAFFYERTLWEHPAARAARDHLRQRSIREETARAWRLGYAPPGWTRFGEAARCAGISAGVLEVAGLAVPRPSGKGHYDRFRARLMIPIRRGGQVIGFGGRVVDSDGEPKYLNSPETALFRKGETLFGLDESATALGSGLPAVVVEGFFDAIALHQAGIRTAIAVCGSTVSENHIVALRAAGARDLVLAFDGDEAGRAAATRAALLGLRSSCATSVLECPEGLDPDEMIHREGPDGFRFRLSQAMYASDFLIKQEFRRLRSSSAIEERIAALSRLASSFASASAKCTASQVQRLAQLVGCSASSIEAFLMQRGLLT